MEIKKIWFKDGLDEDALKKEYRKLAKQWHPDLCKDPNATEVMKEINRQFDEYFSNQRVREFEWVDTWRAKRDAQRVRATILVWLLRDRDNPGKYYAFVERHYIGYWFWRELSQLKAITNDDPEWEGFRGGLAYATYNNPDEFGEVSLKRLPATITPASDEEFYFYIKDHFGDSYWRDYYKIKTRAGTFWAEREKSNSFLIYAKAELPEDFLRIGNANSTEDSKYAARSIHSVYVRDKWIQGYEILEQVNGLDFIYLLYQDCTYEEFRKYHDVDTVPQFAQEVGVKVVDKDFYFIPDPVVAYYARQGIIQILESTRNFRIRCGYFHESVLKSKMHLLSIEDAELIQDYLDEINKQFADHARSLIKKGKIKLKI